MLKSLEHEKLWCYQVIDLQFYCSKVRSADPPILFWLLYSKNRVPWLTLTLMWIPSVMNNKVDDLKQFVCFDHGSSVFTTLQLDYAESTLQQTFKL